MNAPDYLGRFTRVMLRSAPPPVAVLARGKGARVWDAEGNEYLDFLAGIAVNALGHAHPVFVNAVREQVGELAHVSNYFATEAQIEFAEHLARLTGGSRVFLANSGTEAIEAAIKLSRLTGRKRLLALENSFHGRTMGSLSVTASPPLRDPFLPLLPGVDHIAADLAVLEETLRRGDVAALFVEPIQGEAGVLDLPDGFIAGAREVTRRYGTLLILDEIQTGAGRTGNWFAFQHEGVIPDALALAKGIGGGFPVGALVTFGQAANLFGPGHHGSTFGGNPLAARAANAVLSEIGRAGLVENAKLRGAALRAGIAAIASPLVSDIQGRGLLIGVGLAAPLAKELVDLAFSHGLIINAPRDNRIRLAPPLIIGQAEVDKFLELFALALRELPIGGNI